jgi:hypothetical protein
MSSELLFLWRIKITVWVLSTNKRHIDMKHGLGNAAGKPRIARALAMIAGGIGEDLPWTQAKANDREAEESVERSKKGGAQSTERD